ncbi:MAG: VWA domain-containing protein [Desulfurococcales archaeon]|nr:VWA domain-containing protein [Desulfurococcales archaeon]
MAHSIIAGVGEIDEIRMYRGKKIIELASKIGGEQLSDVLTPELAIDVYYSFYLPIPLLEDDAHQLLETGDQRDIIRLATVSNLLSNVNLWRVKPYTVSDSITSIVASASFIEKISRMLPRKLTRPSSGSRGKEGEGNQSSAPQSINDDKIMEAVQKAMEAAERDAKTAKNIKQVVAKVGVGKTSLLEFDESAEEVLRLARETDVSRILEKVEGMKIAVARSRGEDRYSKGWTDGLEYGVDVERVHHSQIALPDDYFYSAYANGRLLLYRKVLPASKGPLYVLLDKSGSMVGSKIDWARAVAIALFRKAVDEGRLFYVRFFDSVAYPPMKLKPRSKSSDIVRLLSYLAKVKAGGGTDITRATAAAVEDMGSIRSTRNKVSDVILITDGEDRLSAELMRKIIKKGNFRLHSVMVQGHNPYLQKISYRYLVVKKLEESDAIRVIDFR